ncbi:ATP-binding cassette domain-containing protein, partial [Virgibacillus halodenitrificans]|nr:ATP-binding cassette domain-containing protein [Virgibacillus halodenitrificans]
GDVVTIVNYAMRVAMSISMFTFIIMAFSRMRASANRLEAVLAEEDVSETNENADKEAIVAKGKISFNEVSFTYPTAKDMVLKNISFRVNAGEKLAIIGATGAGKTSLFQLIPRLFDATKGEIQIDDHPVDAYTLDNLRGSIGFVPQSPLLFTGSITENIAWGKQDATKD